MSNDYKANPTNAPLINRPGESAEFTGTRNIKGLLPAILRTHMNNKFFDSTVEQLMASGSLQPINNYLGKIANTKTSEDNYLSDNRLVDNYQFVPSMVSRDDNENITGVLSYDDLIESLEFQGVDTNNHNKLFNELGYTLGLPINYDMFINYHKYFWMLNNLPVNDIVPTVSDPIDIDDIVGEINYTTPTLANGKTLEFGNGMRIRFSPIDIQRYIQGTDTVSGTTTFAMGLVNPSETKVYLNNELVTEGVEYNIVGNDVVFVVAPADTDEIEVHCSWVTSTSGDYTTGTVYIVDNVGQPDGIVLINQFGESTNPFDLTLGQPLGKQNWLNHTMYSDYVGTIYETPTGYDSTPFDERYHDIIDRDYVVEFRFSDDQSAWARSNLWVKQDVIAEICDYNDLSLKDYTTELYRAVRPIIEFRGNTEKYNFGTNHILNVDHVMELIPDPSTDILGQTDFSLAAFVATTPWAETGFEIGDKVYFELGGNTTYWECIRSHGSARTPYHIQNKEYWKQILSTNIENNDTILFLDSGPTYSENIYRATVDTNGTITALTEIVGSGSTPPSVGDKIVVVVGYNDVFGDTAAEKNHIWSGSEWYWQGVQWNFGQQKEHKGKGVLYQMYDIDGVKLDDTTAYPNSTFEGDFMFDYAKSDTSVYDFALGFKAKRVDYGHNPGFEFNIGCSNVRYEYNVVNPNPNQADNDVLNVLPIKGFYYYKETDTGLLFNNWKEVDQPVKRAYQNIFEEAETSHIINLGTVDVNVDDKFDVLKRGDGLDFFRSSTTNSATDLTRLNGLNPILYLKRNKTYTFKTHFDETEIEFTDTKGNVLAGITRSAATDNVFTITIDNTVTENIIKYTKTSGTPNSGFIFLNDGELDYTIDITVRNSSGTTVIPETSLTVSDNLLTIDYSFAVDDVLDVQWHTDDSLTTVADGYWLPADSHVMNPQNERLTSASYGDLQAHIKSQMESIPGFVGDYFGDNNYVSIPFNNIFGGTIRQQAFSTELLAQTSSAVDTNPYSSIKYNAQQYRRFISQFKTKVKQLHNSLDITVPVYELVDSALQQMNVGKNRSSAFAQSDMAFYKDFESVDIRWHNGDSQTFDLPRPVNQFNDTFNHIQVWIKDTNTNGVNRWRLLRKDVDYTLTDYNLTITTGITYDADDDAYAHIRWYPQNAVSYIPPSAAKLGLVRPYRPEQVSNFTENEYVDFGYIENQEDYVELDVSNVILLHDGGIHIRLGNELYDRSSSDFNIIDAAIWDLENRIVNNLNEGLDTVVDYREIMPTANRSTRITWNALNDALEPDFIKWKIRNSVDELNDETYYNSLDKFTWNYSSVGPGIGGYKGLYTYYFNTDSPHLRPWEMFGYHTKPTWWDANYAWDDVGKRAALIEALKVGHYNNPADTPKYDITYAYSSYDWDANTLVTTGIILNDPVTANVVSTPTSVEASKDFVYGDWGPVEASWRISSDYRISLFAALMKLRPLWVTNTFFNSINRRKLDDTGYENIQYYFADSRELGNNRMPNFTYTPYEGNIIEYIKVLNGGSGYATAPELTVFSNFGSDAEVTAHIEGGVVVAATISETGENYQSKPIVVADSGAAEFETFLLSDATKYFAGFSNCIVEYSRFNNIQIDDLETRFENMEYNPIIKASGFVNRNNQEFILESSQDKGKIRLPSENISTVLYLGQPRDEKFFGSIKVTKTSEGYRVTGFDNSDETFKYYPVNQNGSKIAVTVNNRLINRYTTFDENVATLQYNTLFSNIQDAYDFIIGYQKYLEKQGWAVTSWIETANDFATWAFNSNTAVGDTIFVKPDTTRIYIHEPETGYFDNVSTKYDGTYNLIDENGKQISSSKVLVSRNINTGDETNYTLIERKDNTTVIHGLRLYTVDLEHVFVFDNSTEFDDVVYNPALGQIQNRITWRGSRTKDWNGKLYSPGYIVNDNTIINNFDTTARELDQYYGVGQTLNNQQMLDVARFNTGYNKPVWAEELLLDDDTTWNLTKGSYKYQGTHNILNALKRTTSLFGDVSDINFYEEWAIRTADYGDTRTNDVLEFQFARDLLITNPQPVRFTDGIKNDSLSDIVIDVDSNSNLLVTGDPGGNFQTRPHTKYNRSEIRTFSEIELFKNDFINAGLPLITETDYRILNNDDFVLFPDDIDGKYKFNTPWLDIEKWDNQTSYNYGDRVIYEGKVWQMVDETQSTGLTRPKEPIQILGSQTGPVVTVSDPSKTVIIGTSLADAQTITIETTSTVTENNPIEILGSVTNPTVPNGDTIVLSTDDNAPVTVTFANSVVENVFQDVSKTGSISNPTIIGGATKKLTIDNIDIPFTNTTPFDETDLNPSSNGTEWNISGGTVNLSFDDGNKNLYIDATSADITVFDFAATGTIRKFRVVYDPNPGSPVTTAYQDVDSSINIPLNSNFTGVDIEVYEWPTQLDFDTDSNRTTHAIYSNVDIKQADSGVTGDTYTLSEIISEIQGVLDPSIYTIDSVSNRLRITKTTATPLVQFSLRINAATANAEVGFLATDELIVSSSVPVTSNPDLTLTQVVDQINAFLGTTNITASNSNNTLKLVSNTNSLTIGAGTSNNDLGLTSGTTVASTNEITTKINSNLQKVIDSINLAGISGISASNANERLKITSTNPTLYIGSGTANSELGLIAGTTNAQPGSVSNVFESIRYENGQEITVFLELEHDPHTFNIWVADDNERGGYNVFQAMDFGFYIKGACAGITEADDAEIRLDGSNHNLVIGDYVLIRGSNTTPSIDGIHQVSSTDSDDLTKFYIDEFIEVEGNVGNVYPLKSIRFSSIANLQSVYNQQVNGVYKYNFVGLRQGIPAEWIYAFVDSDDTGVPAVYRFDGTFTLSNGHVGEWRKYRQSNTQARNDLIDNVKMYDAVNQTVIDMFEVYDPFKGIIPGFIEREIDFIQTNDVAVYNFDTLNGGNISDKTWQDDYIGKRWWDLKSAVYLNYEQGSLDYKQNNWGRLFDAASIDVYEWTRSPVLPEEWKEFVDGGSTVDGVVASGEPYSTVVDGETVYYWTEALYYNNRNKRSETVYYFWVKNKLSKTADKLYNTVQLETILKNPTGFGVKWMAAISDSEILVANGFETSSDNTVIQINQRYTDSEALTNSEYTLLAEDYPTGYIPEYLHIKMRDSLVGYNKYSERYTYDTFDIGRTYSVQEVVQEGSDFYISISDSNLGNTPSLDTANSYWDRVYDYSLPDDTPADDIDILKPKLIPDIRLHPFNRYGHLERPVQSLIRNPVEARQNIVETINDLFSKEVYVNVFSNIEDVLSIEFTEGEVTYELDRYWSYVDYIRRVYSDDGSLSYEFDTDLVPEYTVNKWDDIENSDDYEENDLVYVRYVEHYDGLNRPVIVRRIDDEWITEWKKYGTIAVSEEIWNQNKFGHGFDVASFDTAGNDSNVTNILQKLLDVLREDIFVNENKDMYSKLWFSWLYQAVTENTTSEFAFKSTYGTLKVDHPLLTDAKRYQRYTTQPIEDFINDNKPFHTKVRQVIDSPTHQETSGIEVSESYTINIIV